MTTLPSLSLGTLIEKPWGSEEIWALVPGHYCGKFLRVDAGKRLSLQYHVRKHETMRLLHGEGYLLLGETLAKLERVEMETDVSVHIPAGWVHRLCAITDIVVLEASTTELEDVVRMDDDFLR